MNIYEELEWRGLVADCTDPTELQKRLATGPITLYAGFDPTADSLHVGSLVPLLALRRFQLAGHHPISVAGGATGSIGDPSGKSVERNLLDIVHGPSTLTPADLEQLRVRLDAAALLFKVRVLHDELRERETAPASPRKTI